MCSKAGNDCARQLKADDGNCLIPCEGIYATIKKKEVQTVDEKTPGMEKLLEAYERYKNQYKNATIYPSALSGMFM